MNDFNDKVIAEFRANDGRVGGNFEGAPLLILHSTGARSGVVRESPMMYRQDGERWLVFASKAGAPDNPDWYHNLKANPEATAEVATDAGIETVTVHAEELTGDERTAKYADQAADYPGFADYEKLTDRVIPVVALTRA